MHKRIVTPGGFKLLMRINNGYQVWSKDLDPQGEVTMLISSDKGKWTPYQFHSQILTMVNGSYRTVMSGKMSLADFVNLIKFGHQ